MKIIALTDVGHALARSPNGDESPSWRMIYFLDRRGGQSTDDQLENYSGLSRGEVNMAIRKLTHMKPPVVKIVG